MPGMPPKVDHLRVQFERSIDSASKLYASVLKVGGINPAAKCPRLHTQHVRRVVELAFLGVVGFWEEFLEHTLVRYIAGAETKHGYAPTLRLGKAASIDHAYHLITGDPGFDPTRGFVGLSDPTKTMDLAKLYLEGGRPYVPALMKKKDHLIDAIRLRNRVAHSSTKSREDFKKTAHHLLNKRKLTQGYRVGTLLTSHATRHFGRSAADRNLTYFQAFMEMYSKLSKKIVP